MSESLQGGCQCGQVRFSVARPPTFAFFCQCRSCQYMSGAGHAAQFVTQAEDFTVTGDTATWQRVTEAGSTVTKHFCPTCGTAVYGTTTRAESIALVSIGVLDDPAAVTPLKIMHADEAQPWDTISVP